MKTSRNFIIILHLKIKQEVKITQFKTSKPFFIKFHPNSRKLNYTSLHMQLKMAKLDNTHNLMYMI